MTSLLSAKPIDPKNRLIVALDLPDAEAARALVIELGDAVVFYKIGRELFMTGGYFDLLHWLVGQGKKVFVDLKFFDVPETVRSAVRTLAAGVDGIVSSGLEAPMIRRELGDKLMVVTPGIRPVENKPVDDQKRTVDVAQAFRNGADYIVVGRPIRQAANPREAAIKLQQTIREVFSPSGG